MPARFAWRSCGVDVLVGGFEDGFGRKVERPRDFHNGAELRAVTGFAEFEIVYGRRTHVGLCREFSQAHARLFARIEEEGG